MPTFTRRELLTAITTLGAGALTGLRPAWSQPRSGRSPRFLVVLTCTGGASPLDSFLAVKSSECPRPLEFNTFPDDEVVELDDSIFRAVRLSDETLNAEGFRSLPLVFDREVQSRFLERHFRQMLAFQFDATSIDHPVAQYRAMTGGGAWRGRTLQECVALAYGSELPLPNVNMSRTGFLENGTDLEIPAWAQREAVAAPLDWPLGLDGARGQLGLPSRDAIQRARLLRDEELEGPREFRRLHSNDPRLNRFATNRRGQSRRFEEQGLIEKLSLRSAVEWLPASPDRDLVRHAFPLLDLDPLQAQAALTFLLIKHRVSAAITLGPTNEPLTLPGIGLVNTSMAFDLAHGNNRLVQAAMWARVLDVADRLIDLLAQEVFDPETGESCWDRTMLYFATEFGRDQRRIPLPDGGPRLAFPSPHHPSNAVLVMSPSLPGNRMLGGLDRTTLTFHGFDPINGAPNPDRRMREAEFFSGILSALEVDTAGSGLPEVAALRSG